MSNTQEFNAFVLRYGTDLDALDSGMSVAEARRRAKNWWENKGRREMRLQLLRQRLPQAKGGNDGQFNTDDPDDPNFLPSPLLNAYAWEDLDEVNQRWVVLVWHHFAIRIPDMTDEDPEEAYRFGQKDKVN